MYFKLPPPEHYAVTVLGATTFYIDDQHPPTWKIGQVIGLCMGNTYKISIPTYLDRLKNIVLDENKVEEHFQQFRNKCTHVAIFESLTRNPTDKLYRTHATGCWPYTYGVKCMNLETLETPIEIRATGGNTCYKKDYHTPCPLRIKTDEWKAKGLVLCL